MYLNTTLISLNFGFLIQREYMNTPNFLKFIRQKDKGSEKMFAFCTAVFNIFHLS